MSIFHNCGLLVPSGKRLVIVPTGDFSWFTVPDETIMHEGEVFEDERNFAEWFALIEKGTDQLIGISMTFLELTDVVEALCREFSNVSMGEGGYLNVIFTESASFECPGFPMLPVSVFRSAGGKFVFRIPQFFE